MCVGPFGSKPKTPAQPQPTPPTTPPPPVPVQQAPTPLPETPTPAPATTDQTKREAKVSGKKASRKGPSKGTTQLQTTKAEGTGLNTGGETLQGINTGTTRRAAIRGNAKSAAAQTLSY